MNEQNITENKSISVFKSFDFDKSLEFEKYLENIFPRPTGLLLKKFKRKFYKKTIDPDFEINFDGINKKVPYIIHLSKIINKPIIL